MLAEQRKRFRVEINEPLYADSLPLTFYARIYENDQHHGSIFCTVSEEDLSAIPVVTRRTDPWGWDRSAYSPTRKSCTFDCR